MTEEKFNNKKVQLSSVLLYAHIYHVRLIRDGEPRADASFTQLLSSNTREKKN